MENKKVAGWVVGIIVLAVIAIIILLTIQKKRDARPFNVRTFPETVMVTNGTEYRADTIVKVLAYDVFDINTLDLKIYYIPIVANEGEMEFFGFVQKLPFGEHKYLILLKRGLAFEKLKEILSHEFVHIDQYERGDLQVSGKTYIWKGEPGVVEKYDISLPFEMEAFKSQHNVKKELNRYLYD